MLKDPWKVYKEWGCLLTTVKQCDGFDVLSDKMLKLLVPKLNIVFGSFEVTDIIKHSSTST